MDGSCEKSMDAKHCPHETLRAKPIKDHGPFMPAQPTKEVEIYEKCCHCGTETQPVREAKL